MMKVQTILILVGLKGAGKSTIGKLLEKELGISFLRVEPIYLRAIQENPDLTPLELEPVGFGAILEAVDLLAKTNNVICLESTGTAEYFSEFLSRLEEKYRIYLIRIEAPADVCMKRVFSRDKTDHIPVSDERLRYINQVAATVSLSWDMEIDNTSQRNDRAIVDGIAKLLRL